MSVSNPISSLMGFNASPVVQFRLPDTVHNWPWPRRLNPHYLECKAESQSWCEAFNAFSPKAQTAFNRCDFNLLASLAYPLHNKAGLRIGCDLMNLFFVIDEHSDVTDKKGARRQADVIMDALKNPCVPRPQEEWVGGEVARQFWLNAIQTASPTSQRRFIDSFQSYMDAVVQQAEDRDDKHVRSIQGYFDVRRNTIGARPSFAILEIDMDLPDEVFYDPTIVKLTALCIDMLILGNDMVSYNVEQARDDGHNVVTIVMHELKTDLNGALDWVSKYHDDIAGQFLEAFRNLPSWGKPLDAEVARYVDGLGRWVRANDSWSFESQRYFGTKGLDIQKNRLVDLLPKRLKEV